MSSHHKKVDRIEPYAERCAAILKNRASAGIHVITTGRARKGVAAGELVKGPLTPARLADMPQAVADFHDVSQASVIVREPGEELTDREPAEIFQFGTRLMYAWLAFSGHREPLSSPYYSPSIRVSRG